jgi:hypothetical protein
LDAKKIQDLSPWNIKGNPLILKPWEAGSTLSEIDFSKGAYWVQVHGPPIELITAQNASLTTILAINSPHLSTEWASAHVFTNINLHLLSFSEWTALKVSRCANFCAHHIAKWAASNLVFGSISTHSPMFSSLRFRSGKDPKDTPPFVILFFPL